MDNFAKDFSDEVLKTQFKMLINTIYNKHTKIFTNGCKIKEPQSTSAAIYIEQKKITALWKLPRNTQIFEAELYAIKQSLKYIEVNNLTNSVIFTDSLSSMLILQNNKPSNYKQITYKTQNKFTLTIQIIMPQYNGFQYIKES